MRSEASKRLKDGFTLTEQELRRIHSLIDEQMGKICDANALETKYEVKFQNGVIAQPNSLDEILSFENLGSGKLLRLSMESECQDTIVLLQFEDIRARDGDFSSIKYTVTGQDRDWVFVTSSILNERVSRIKTFRTDHLSSFPAMLYLVLGMMAAFICLSLIDFPGMPRSEDQDVRETITHLQEERNAGKTLDAADVILQIEKSKLKNELSASLLWPFSVVMGFAIIAAGVFWLISTAVTYSWPAFNFLWGDYLPLYEKRQSQGKFILYGIIGAIILSVTGNFIYGWLTKH